MATRRVKAQSLGEYTLVTSLVILAIMAMILFMQRAFNARVNDARGYMLDTLHSDMEDIRFLRGEKKTGRAYAEYEPYYADKVSDVDTNPQTNLLINGLDDSYTLKSKAGTAINSVSRELPAKDYKTGTGPW